MANHNNGCTDVIYRFVYINSERIRFSARFPRCAQFQIHGEIVDSGESGQSGQSGGFVVYGRNYLLTIIWLILNIIIMILYMYIYIVLYSNHHSYHVIKHGSNQFGNV